MTVAAAKIAFNPPLANAQSVVPGIAGFFFIARYCVTFLFFQSNPATSSLFIITLGVLLAYFSLLAEGHEALWTEWTHFSFTRWLALYCAFTGISIFWSGAQSKWVALAYWVGMVMDVVTALVLLSDPLTRVTNLSQLFKGAALGGMALAIVGWLSPALPDLRLGDVVFLHPNTLGLYIGLTTLIAVHLASQQRVWKWILIFLAVTLLRTLSKTSIIAFAITGIWMLWSARSLSVTRKIKVFFIAAIVVTCFSGLLISYLQIYNDTGSGIQLETLTGRTVLWVTAISLAMQAPLLGHGFYSFRTLIPSFGDFQPWHAHDELIQIFFEFGALGVTLAAVAHWKFFTAMHHARADLRSLALSVLLFSLVHGLTDTVPFGFSLPLWLMCALPLATHDGAHPAATQ